jgi:hypothetical protein
MNMAPVLTVTAAPNTMAVTTTNATAANHIWIDLERVIGRGIWSPGCVQKRDDGLWRVWTCQGRRNVQ